MAIHETQGFKPDACGGLKPHHCQQTPPDDGHVVDRTLEDERATSGCVVHAGQSYVGKQGPNYTPGVSTETVGARGLWLGSVTLPPRGGRTKAHIHEKHESAFYFVSGEEVELYTGDQLQHREIAHPGDYLYIPAGVPHVAVNCSATPAVFVGARTDPNEQESVVMRPDLEARVP